MGVAGAKCCTCRNSLTRLGLMRQNRPDFRMEAAAEASGALKCDFASNHCHPHSDLIDPFRLYSRPGTPGASRPRVRSAKTPYALPEV